MTVLLYHLRLAVTSTFLLTASTAFAFGQGCPNFGFTPAASPATGTYPASVVTADFNNDGVADLATVNYVSNDISVLLGSGGGTFAPAVSYPNPGDPFSIAAGDLNNDGNPDMATANSGSNNLTVWIGNGAGGFTNAGTLGVGSSPFAVYINDLNGDGNRDLLAANYGSNTVSVLLGNGAGGFGAGSNYASGQTPIAVVFGDFDANGTVDLAAANNVSDTFSVLSGNGNGTFNAPTPYAVGQFPQSIAAADFNEDGLLDVATANSSSANVSVRLNLPGGGFGAPVNFAVGNTPYGIAAADFNQDGNADIVTANFFSANASILLGSGNGSFAAATNVSTGQEPGSVAVGDLNGDGSPDLALANTGSNNVSILLNNCAGSTNTAPAIQAAPVTRQKGAPASGSVIATVNDAEDAEADLSITINGGGSATVNGVTVANLTVDANGTVQADVSAACGASNASFTLRVTDSGGLFAEATLNVTVTSSNAPVLTLNASISIFPHNGKLRTVSMNEMLAGASDDCDGDLSSSVVIEQVTSDELTKNTKNKDIVIGGDCRSVALRADRNNDGDGRVYSIRLRGSDADGNVSTAEFKVTVPINPSSGPAIEGQPVITIGGYCH